MKRILAFLLLGCSGTDALAQGCVQFRNYYTGTPPPINAPVHFGWDIGLRPDSSNPLWRAALIGGPTTAMAASLQTPGTLQMMYYPVNSTITWANFRSGSTPPAAPGYVNTGSAAARAVPGVDWGGTALVQMVAWQGNYNTWAEAFAAWQSAAPGVLIGISNPLTLRLPSASTDPNCTYLWGLNSFSLGGMTPPPPPPTPYFRGSYGPYDQTLYAGEDASLQVSADASPAPYSYQWFRNGTSVPGVTGNYLSITNARPEDNGSQYYVLMFHQLGTFTSRVATVTVVSGPPIITSQPQSQTVPAATGVHFGVTAGGPVPRAYQWMLNVTNAIPDATNSTLDLAVVLCAQAGIYSVLVSNGFGSVTSSPATLTVIDPYIYTQPFDQSPGLGQTALLSVAAQGTQPLSFQWLQNAAPLSDGGGISGTRSPRLQVTDAGGNYSALVSNACGVITSRVAKVMVLDPFITANPASQSVLEGDFVVFSVQAGGTQPLVYQWLKDGKPLKDGGGLSGVHSATLTLESVAAEDTGTYWVIVSNSRGSATSTQASLIMSGYRVLHNFTGGEGGSGSWAGGPVLAGTVLYGTTCYGGSSNNLGTVYKVNTDGSGFTVLHRFTGFDGSYPHGRLVVSGDTLYGTTSEGGSLYMPNGANGYGTIFRLNTDGTGFAVLKSFEGYSNGYYPEAGLILSGQTLYGTARGGNSIWNQGMVFRLNTDGTAFRVLHNFDGLEGESPNELVLSEGTLYGTTGANGIIETNGYVSVVGNGTVFKVSTEGTDFAVIKNLDGSDARNPYGRVLLSSNYLYATTLSGGFTNNYWRGGIGTIFKVKTDGSDFQVLKRCTEQEGAEPGGLVLSGSTLFGMVYNLTNAAGNQKIFALNTDGSEFSVLKELSAAEGAGLIINGLQLSGSTLFGSTFYGGLSNAGVVFAYAVPLPKMLDGPVTQTAEEGSSVFFRVRAGGASPLSYQWFFNGTNTIGGVTDAMLRLVSVGVSNIGTYSVRVTNAWGSLVSEASLNVIPLVERRPVVALNLAGTTGQSFSLETAPVLQPGPNWLPLDTVTLTNASQLYLDAAPISTQRFYRARQPPGASPAPSLGVHLIPAIRLAGPVGSSVRIDSINRFGPTDAWVTLATVTLTNASQEYFDTSAIGQPPRLYRLVALP